MNMQGVNNFLLEKQITNFLQQNNRALIKLPLMQLELVYYECQLRININPVEHSWIDE